MFDAKFQPRMTVNRANEMVNDLMALANKLVLVGVPEQRDPRRDTTAGQKRKIGNAGLAYIHDNGAPRSGIPARPFMQPGISRAQERINLELLQAARAQLTGDRDKVDLHLRRAGLIAQNSIRSVINEGEDFEPIQEATKRARIRRRRAYQRLPRRSEARRRYMENTQAERDSMHPLVDTAQLRNSITYVIAEKFLGVIYVRNRGQ